MIGRPRVELVLAGFGDSYWVGVTFLLLLLLLFSLAPPSQSNWLLLFLFTLLAGHITHAVDRLCEWPNATLVPGFATGVFLTCMGTVVGMALFSTLPAWSRGVPAVGPAILVGLATVALALRFGRYMCATAVVMVFLGIVWDRKTGALGAMLADPWIQAGTLVLAAIAAVVLLHMLKAPGGQRAVPERQLPLQPRGTARELGLSALWLAAIILSLLVEPLSRLLDLIAVFYIGAMLGHVAGAFDDIHLQLSRNWILPTTRSRAQLARRCTGRVVARSLTWFPAGLTAAVLQGLDAQQDPLLHVLLLSHIAVLVLIAFLAGVVRPWPQKSPLPWLLIVVPPTVFLGFVVVLLALVFQHTVTGYALLVAAFIGSTVLAVFGGGRGLAKAEVVE